MTELTKEMDRLCSSEVETSTIENSVSFPFIQVLTPMKVFWFLVLVSLFIRFFVLKG